MNTADNHAASEVVSSLLRGAQLDTIRVYSLIIQLGFVRRSSIQGYPDQIWVSASGNLTLGDSYFLTDNLDSTVDFFEKRACVLSAVYRLIGKEITVARVTDFGVLTIELDGKHLHAKADNENLEVVWEVLSDSPDANISHKWHVVLDNSGIVSAHTPSIQ